MKQKNVFFKAGILLLSLLLLPGMTGCGAITNLIATPTPTATSTPTLTPTKPPTSTPTFTPIPTDTPTPTPTSYPKLDVTRQSIQSFFEKEGYSFKSIPNIDGLPAVEGTAPSGIRAGFIVIVGQPESIARVSLTVDVLENEPADVAYLMQSLIGLSIASPNRKKALDWMPNGMRESIDKGSSEFTIGDVKILIEFKGSAYILTISPSPKGTSSASPFLLECAALQVKMQASQTGYPPNIIAMAGQPVGAPIGALQINLSNETGASKRAISITFGSFTQTFRGKVYPSLLTVGTVDGTWTFTDSKNVYTINGEIAYNLSDMTKLLGYHISVSGLGTTQVCQSE